MIELFPAKCRNEILHCSGSVWAGVVMKHHNTLAKHATLLILDRAMQFLKCVAIDTCVNCADLSKRSTTRTPFLSQNIVHMIFRVEVVCLNFISVGNEVCLRSMDPFRFIRGFVRHPCLIPCDYTAQEVFAFLTVSCQKVQRAGPPFQFVFFHKHLRHPACTQFPKLKFFRHNFVKKWPWNLREMQGKWCNGELSVLSNLLFNRTHQIFIHHRQSAAPNIFTSSLKNRTHLRTTEIHMACSPYTSKSWRISAGFTFFAFKQRITDRISHVVGFSIFLNIINTKHDA